MKELGISWSELKSLPRHELDGLMLAYTNYNNIHAFDGYSPKEIAELSKDKPETRTQYNKSKELKAKFEERAGIKKRKKVISFTEMM